jgi:uncharacterized Fe-S center protein
MGTDKKPKVYFVKSENYRDVEKVKHDFRTLIKTGVLLENIEKKSLVGIKLSFGEKANKGYIDPRVVKVMVDKIKSKAAKPFLTDTNVIYHGSRMQAVDHLEMANEHGFSQDTVGCPLIIADGLLGENIVDIEIRKRHIKKARLAGLVFHLDYLVSLAHFTGHMLTGFASTIKNIGMGLASRPGKLQQHANVKPKVIKKNCLFCKQCLKVCPVKAIIEKGNVVFIQDDICIGCADCLVACKFDAIEVNYGEAAEIIGEKMVEYAWAVASSIKNKIFFNFLIRITKECDCLSKDEPAVVEDIGILACDDPVAIDKAGVDLVFEKSGDRDIFAKLHPHACSAITQLRYAQEIGLGNMDYELIEIK